MNSKKNELIDLIEFNWQCLLMTRAIFNYKHFGIDNKYSSPSLYTKYNINVEVNWVNMGRFSSDFSSKQLQYWHNANFLIRIYGLLDEFNIISLKENRVKYPILELIYFLRHKIGAHQSGIRKPKKKYIQEVNELFNKIGIKEMNGDSISNYNLAIDAVLYKIVLKLKEIVREILK